MIPVQVVEVVVVVVMNMMVVAVMKVYTRGGFGSDGSSGDRPLLLIPLQGLLKGKSAISSTPRSHQRARQSLETSRGFLKE